MAEESWHAARLIPTSAVRLGSMTGAGRSVSLARWQTSGSGCQLCPEGEELLAVAPSRGDWHTPWFPVVATTNMILTAVVVSGLLNRALGLNALASRSARRTDPRSEFATASNRPTAPPPRSCHPDRGRLVAGPVGSRSSEAGGPGRGAPGEKQRLPGGAGHRPLRGGRRRLHRPWVRRGRLEENFAEAPRTGPPSPWPGGP